MKGHVCEMAKWENIILTIKENLEILELIKCDTSYTLITEKIAIRRSTVSDIKKSVEKL